MLQSDEEDAEHNEQPTWNENENNDGEDEDMDEDELFRKREILLDTEPVNHHEVRIWQIRIFQYVLKYCFVFHIGACKFFELGKILILEKLRILSLNRPSSMQ